MIREFSIKITRYRNHDNEDFNEKLKWFSESLGLFNERDKEKSCFRVFFELLKSNNNNLILSSDEIAEKSHLTRATAIHHLNKLMDSGLVITKKNKYMLRVNDLHELISEIRYEINKTLDELSKESNKINKELKERLKDESQIL
jgi:predicted transcriptional regulator